ncbi:hypothetical protein BJ970_007577 [Saccharopolyspora phatthalungensis]|uniref:Uncharacterized protein n=1 Tax=Saccharopolyspora phatthalungensis TaxID=664693 RepID=A0A840QHH8_9PSEU|nr:hypothetical protein [Saccharopolyspora phatthalungensis]
MERPTKPIPLTGSVPTCPEATTKTWFSAARARMKNSQWSSRGLRKAEAHTIMRAPRRKNSPSWQSTYC